MCKGRIEMAVAVQRCKLKQAQKMTYQLGSEPELNKGKLERWTY